jgi:hypothetical protein
MRGLARLAGIHLTWRMVIRKLPIEREGDSRDRTKEIQGTGRLLPGFQRTGPDSKLRDRSNIERISNYLLHFYGHGLTKARINGQVNCWLPDSVSRERRFRGQVDYCPDFTGQARSKLRDRSNIGRISNYTLHFYYMLCSVAPAYAFPTSQRRRSEFLPLHFKSR